MNLPMLLTGYDRSIFRQGKIYVSEKYDGWRMFYRKGKFYTRRGKEIRLPKKFYTPLKEYDYEFDGELWLGYETTSSDITATADFKNAKFMIFDIPDIKMPFGDRYEELKDIDIETENIKVVKQTPCNEVLMEKIYKRVLARGGEGVVLRPASQMYKYDTRDNDFQKKKPFSTLEAIVVGYFNSAKGMEKKGYVSSLIVHSIVDKVEFKVSFKSTCPPKEGSIVTVRFSQRTSTGLPKFPVLVGIRDAMDLPDEAIKVVEKRKYTVTPLVVDLDHPNCDGVITASECESSPPRKIQKGRHVYYDNERGRKYKVTCDREGRTVYCSCEAWKYQILPAVFRTCKHCVAIYDYDPKVPWEVRNSSKKKHALKRKRVDK